MTLKVQIKGAFSVNAMIKSNVDKDDIPNKWLTFHAFSEKMKASILELMAFDKSKTIMVSILPNNEMPIVGEWYED